MLATVCCRFGSEGLVKKLNFCSFLFLLVITTLCDVPSPRLFWYLSASPQFPRKNSSFHQKLKSTQSFITFLRNIDEDDDVGDKELRRSVQVDSDRAIPLLLANFAHHPQKGPIARGAWKELFLGALNIPPSNCPYLQTNFIYWVSYASLYFENWKVEWHVLWLLIDHKTCLDTWMSLNSLARSKENVLYRKIMYCIQRKCIVSKENVLYQRKCIVSKENVLYLEKMYCIQRKYTLSKAIIFYQKKMYGIQRKSATFETDF